MINLVMRSIKYCVIIIFLMFFFYLHHRLRWRHANNTYSYNSITRRRAYNIQTVVSVKNDTDNFFFFHASLIIFFSLLKNSTYYEALFQIIIIIYYIIIIIIIIYIYIIYNILGLAHHYIVYICDSNIEQLLLEIKR